MKNLFTVRSFITNTLEILRREVYPEELRAPFNTMLIDGLQFNLIKYEN